MGRVAHLDLPASHDSPGASHSRPAHVRPPPRRARVHPHDRVVRSFVEGGGDFLGHQRPGVRPEERDNPRQFLQNAFRKEGHRNIPARGFGLRGESPPKAKYSQQEGEREIHRVGEEDQQPNQRGCMTSRHLLRRHRRAEHAVVGPPHLHERCSRVAVVHPPSGIDERSLAEEGIAFFVLVGGPAWVTAAPVQCAMKACRV